jgi:molybdopterin-guanine dinucleotide biosynthesis protein A
MIIDAIVLAGGRASRLDGTSKAALPFAGRSLLEITLASLEFAHRVVVVGDADDIGLAAPGADVLIAREFPFFAGPAAAIAAGMDALAAASTEAVATYGMVVACDMPAVAAAIDALIAALKDEPAGVVAVSSDGRVQPLVGIYPTSHLTESITRHREAGDLKNLSVRALLSGLTPAHVPVPEGSTDDVDTWADAARLGVLVPQSTPTKD